MRGYWSAGRLHMLQDDGTLGVLPPESEGKSQPPWAEHQFSFRFTGLPPLEAYEYQDTMELIQDDLHVGRPRRS